MKATGVTRKIDELGRLVIPIELRRSLGMGIGDPIEIFTNDDSEVILRKYEPNIKCAITGEVDSDNMEFAGGKIVLSEEGAHQLVAEIKSYLE